MLCAGRSGEVSYTLSDGDAFALQSAGSHALVLLLLTSVTCGVVVPEEGVTLDSQLLFSNSL